MYPKYINTFLTIVIIVVVIGCATTGPGGKKSIILIPVETEIALGIQMDQQVRKEYQILEDSLWQNYLDDVGQKIVAVCDRKDIQYHFAVIDSDEI